MEQFTKEQLNAAKGIIEYLNESFRNDMARWTDGEILLYQDLLFFNEQLQNPKWSVQAGTCRCWVLMNCLQTMS